MYSITFTKQLSLNTEPALQPGQTRLRIVITAVVGFTDLGMLVFQVGPQTGVNYYSHPATPVDLTTYNYQTAGNKPFVRLAVLDQYYETAVLAEEAAATIGAALQQLCTDMTVLQDLSSAVTVTVSA